MALIDYLDEQKSCPRCSACKWITLDQYNGPATQAICPSLEKYQFHSYSGAGKLHACIAINEEKVPLDQSAADLAYKCNLCGGCDYTCKAYRKDMDLCENFEELRIACVEAGLAPEAHLNMMKMFTSTDDFYGREKSARIDWTKDVGIKRVAAGETGEIFFHTGMDALYQPENAARTAKTAALLLKLGADLVAAGVEEANSGYEAFALGHIDAARTAAVNLHKQIALSGATTVVTLDAHSYMTMRYYFPKYGVNLGVKILHITEYLAELLDKGVLKLKHSVDVTVTYHDPCYLGRRSEPYKPYDGPKESRPVVFARTGEKGVYDAPRKLLAAIPGVKLIEMDRIKGYAWCCGGGAGVQQAYPELSEFSANERMREAKATNAELLVTACSGCEHILGGTPDSMPVADILDLILKSEGGENG